MVRRGCLHSVALLHAIVALILMLISAPQSQMQMSDVYIEIIVSQDGNNEFVLALNINAPTCPMA